MPNPFRLLGIYATANTLLRLLDQAKRLPALYATRVWWSDVLLTARALALKLPIPEPLHRRLTVKNWKTMLGGVSAILGVAVKAINGGGVSAEDIPIVIAAIGLLFAKDHDVSGGSRLQ